MDRKIREHKDKPPHQRWLYKLADSGLGNALLLIWGICVFSIAVALFLVKWVISLTK